TGVRTGLLGGLGGTARDVEGHGGGLFVGVAVVALPDSGDGAGGPIRIDGRGVDFEALGLEVVRRRGLGEPAVVVPVALDRARRLRGRGRGGRLRLRFGIPAAEEVPQQGADGDEGDDREDPDEHSAFVRRLVLDVLVLRVVRGEFAFARRAGTCGRGPVRV